jgi:hypothetical protein
MPRPCLDCKHLRELDVRKVPQPRGIVPDGNSSCDAFPDESPAEIQSGEHTHRKPFEGDQGIQWELWVKENNEG